MPNGHDAGFKPGPQHEGGEPLDADTFQAYVNSAEAQRYARAVHAQAVADQAAQNGNPPEPEPVQAPAQAPAQAPPRIDSNDPRIDPRLRRNALTPPAKAPGDGELVEWSRGAMLGLAMGAVVGVGIAYLLVSRIESEVSGDEK